MNFQPGGGGVGKNMNSVKWPVMLWINFVKEAIFLFFFQAKTKVIIIFFSYQYFENG